MDEFKPEDELKPDTSDRRPVRQRKVSAIPKIALSRQHVMMIVGILVLLLLVIGIGSALTTPGNQHSQETQTVSTPPASSAAPGSSRTIDLSGSSSMSQTSANNGATVGNHQQISVPAVSPTPTEAPVLPEPANQRRIEVPGDLNHALENNQDQEQLNTVAHGAQSSISSLPTAPASVAPLTPQAVRGAGNKPVAVKSPVAKEPSRPSVRETVGNNAAHRQAPVHATSPSSTVGAGNPLKGEYTLQLSGASQAESLNRWAKNQNLTSYHVYKTERNGQPWYVLVSGAYANPAEAKRAVSSLPAEVRAQNPWVKPVSQVKKEIKK